MSVGSTAVPLDEAAAIAVVAEHRDRFAQVLDEAWDAYASIRRRAQRQMALVRRSARGMMISDLTREPAHRVFAGVGGTRVDDRFGRPWVCLAGGQVQVRFRKLTPMLGLCPSDSERAVRLAFHLGDPLFPDEPPATVLTAGYVLDAAESAIAHLALVCHVGTQVHYTIGLPQRADAMPTPTPMPLVPLSEPVIRSARAAAVRRLRPESGAGA